MERARFPMEFLRVTQGPNVGSHAGSKAMDFGGKDTGKDPIYAPFTGKFVRVRKDSSHESYLESLEPVEFANGVVRQGEKIGDEGGFGGGRPNRFGAHLHIEASRGRNIAYQVQNEVGTYCTPNQVNIWDALWLGTDVQILNDSGYPWQRDVKKEENDMEFLEVTSDRCEVFTDTNVNSVDRTFNNGRLVKGEFYPIQSDVGTDGVYHWVRIQAGDKKRYAVVLEDRSKVVSLSAGDAIAACMAQVPHVDTFELEKKLADMTVEKNAVEKRLTDLKAYAAEV